MSRDAEDVRAALATAAGRTAFDGERTWRDVLFAADGTFSRPGDPDRALLAALGAQYPVLDEHADLLPEQVHVDWLERILAVPRLPVVPDHVVAHVTVDPKLAPAVVGRGTALRGGKDAFGAERRYTTVDALTAHGATVTAVRSLVPGGHDVGLPGLVVEGPPFPVRPSAGTDAPHTLRFHSPVLAYEGGSMTVRLTFTGGSAAGLAGATWHYRQPDGTEATASGSVSGSTVTVALQQGCVADSDSGPSPWLEARVPPSTAVPGTFAFSAVSIAVTSREAYVPEAAYYNDGALDISKEFQPFGAVAKRGDALYLRSDEAFGKPLATVTVSIQVMDTDESTLSSSAGGSGVPMYIATALWQNLNFITGTFGEISPDVQAAIDDITGLVGTSGTPSVEWQQRIGGRWEEFATVGPELAGITNAAVPGTIGSEPAVVGGQRGHFIRAFLAAGDFGWTKYQEDVAAFATQAVADDGSPVMPVPPSPPIVSRLTVRYTTRDVAVERVEAVNGWSRRVWSTGLFHPFTRTVSETGHTAMVAFGLDLPDGALGSSVSVYLEVDSASGCGSTADPGAAWQWWDGSGWQDLAVADGSRMLRESGLLRFVAPGGWTPGCADVDAPTGRWVRLVTGAPDQIGTLTSITPDAVVAAFVSSAADPEQDPSPATALPPGTIKGTVAPVPGVKKVTNLTGVRGRGPEDSRAYRRRASALTRHRGRAIAAWDYEEIVSVTFPEVAAVRCLPHTGPDGARQPGSVGVVVVPDRPGDPQPRPSVSLAGRIAGALEPLTALTATPHVLCAQYVPVTVAATIHLRRGVAALDGLKAVTDALETWLHPTGTTPTRWGRSLYRSSVEAFLDGVGVVDSVELLTMRTEGGTETELVEVDVCRGLYCSSAQHLLDVQEQL